MATPEADEPLHLCEACHEAMKKATGHVFFKAMKGGLVLLSLACLVSRIVSLGAGVFADRQCPLFSTHGFSSSSSSSSFVLPTAV